MASIFRRTYRRPIPEGATFQTRKGQRMAVWTDGRGRTRRAPLSEDGKSVVFEHRCWYVAYTGADGRRVTVKGYTDKAATEELARSKVKLAERIKCGLVTVDLDKASLPFAEGLEAWTDDLRRRGKSAGYVYNVKLLTNKVALGCDWHTLGSIRSDALTTWLADPCRAHLSQRTLNQYLETARAFVNWCCAQEPPWLPGNPLERIAAADETVKTREKRALTLDELDRLRRVSGPRWPIYLTAALTGLRRLELKRLQWGDVRLEGDRPHIQLRAAATKARRADVVAVNPELLEVLRELRPADAAADLRVFKAIPKYATYRKDVEVRARIPWRDDRNRLASFHCLRKTFCTYLALADVPLRVAMDMMRVTDARLLTDTYTDARLFNTSAAAERLPRLVCSEEGEENRTDDKAKGEAAAG